MLLLGAAGALWAGRSADSLLYTRSISAAAAAMRIGRRVALEMHLPISAYRDKGGRLRRQAHKLALLVVITERLREDFERELPALKGRVLVAHDGADERSSPLGPVTAAGAFRVGYVGHLYAGKGMEIISQLIPICPWATFHIIGGSVADIDYWRNRVGESKNVMFHGHVPHAQTSSYIAAMDVVVAPYQRIVKSVGGQDVANWMSPLKLFEYMASSKAIIASDLPVIREVLEDGVTASLCAPDDVQAWASVLRSLRDRPDLRIAFGAGARAAFLSKYTWLQRAKTILGALDTRSSTSTHNEIAMSRGHRRS
jgi:glycosyltransferase involved in cell wall biosynthesis